MSCPMAKKPLPFPERRSAVEPEPLSRSGSRLIFTIADRRFAFEFSSQVTELKPTPARILLLKSDTVKKTPKSRKVGGVARSTEDSNITCNERNSASYSRRTGHGRKHPAHVAKP